MIGVVIEKQFIIKADFKSDVVLAKWDDYPSCCEQIVQHRETHEP